MRELGNGEIRELGNLSNTIFSLLIIFIKDDRNAEETDIADLRRFVT